MEKVSIIITFFKKNHILFSNKLFGDDAMKQTVFTGSACAIITPFDENRKVNYRNLRKLIEFQIKNGTDAIVVCGTTGEGSTLDNREHKQIIKSAVKQAEGRVPIIAGTGSNCTETAVRRSCAALDAGADALLIVTPYYNKCSQQGLCEHYAYISDRVDLPIIVYNVPSRTGVNILPETYLELSRINHVTATKEANGDISALAKTMSLCGDALDVYCGNDDQSAAFAAMGAKGTISVLANIMPQEAHDIVITALEGNNDLSVSLQMKYLRICNDLFCDVNPIPVKYAMKKLGLDSGILRLPLNGPTDRNKEKIISTLKKYDLL